MMIKKNSLWENTLFNPVKFILITCLLILTPITIFLMAFAWYDSIEMHITHDGQIIHQRWFILTSLAYGAIGLVVSLAILFVYLIIDFYLQSMETYLKKIILIASIIIYTLTFANFEIFSFIFIDYYFSIELLLAIIMWPLIYILLISIIVLNHRNSQKNKTEILIKKIFVNEQMFENNEAETTLF